jgi:hypothetical protein
VSGYCVAQSAAREEEIEGDEPLVHPNKVSEKRKGQKFEELKVSFGVYSNHQCG